METMNTYEEIVVPTVTNERIDDYVLILNVIMQTQLAKAVDKVLNIYSGTNKISWGWLLSIWLTHLLSTADHCKLHVLDWVKTNHETLEKITGLKIALANFTDDHLGILLKHLSKEGFWEVIEEELSRTTIKVFDLEKKSVRVDATTVSGHHEETADGLFQFGHAKENPELRQIKVMVAALDPIGYPICTHTVSGEKSDDVLYLGVIRQAVKTLEKEGLLFVGDCKMTAIETRATIEQMNQYYLGPLAMVGKNKELAESLINHCIENPEEMFDISVQDEKDGEIFYAQGYETSRNNTYNGKTWKERIFVSKSIRYHKSESTRLDGNIEKAMQKLLVLTPPRGKGIRQIKTEEELREKIDGILKKYRVEGLITVNYVLEEKLSKKSTVREKGSENSGDKDVVAIRYQVTQVEPDMEAIAETKKRLGWKIFVTNAPDEKLTLSEGILKYRDEWIIERGFARMKGSALQLAPVYMKRDDQIKGLSHLISLGVRYLSLIEFVVRRSLKANKEKLSNLHAENKQKKTDKPTTERILKALCGITITRIKKGNTVEKYLTKLTETQKRIIELMGFSVSIYESLILE